MPGSRSNLNQRSLCMTKTNSLSRLTRGGHGSIALVVLQERDEVRGLIEQLMGSQQQETAIREWLFNDLMTPRILHLHRGVDRYRLLVLPLHLVRENNVFGVELCWSHITNLLLLEVIDHGLGLITFLLHP